MKKEVEYVVFKTKGQGAKPLGVEANATTVQRCTKE